MGNKDFYARKSYRETQRMRTKFHWEKGTFNFLKKRVQKVCARPGCGISFETTPSNPKKYCSQPCAARVSNTGRIKSSETRARISKALTGKSHPERRGITVIDIVCKNPKCQKTFQTEPWKHAKYCCNKCTMAVVGGRPTSPKAARAKAGIRPDIDPHIYFFSRWEANYARILNLQGIKWVHQPKRFRLATQWYTPDFFLPSTNTYIEIKNYLSEYSQKRDAGFRTLYPREKLILILKDDYKKLEQHYAPLIPNWEYSK